MWRAASRHFLLGRPCYVTFHFWLYVVCLCAYSVLFISVCICMCVSLLMNCQGIYCIPMCSILGRDSRLSQKIYSVNANQALPASRALAKMPLLDVLLKSSSSWKSASVHPLKEAWACNAWLDQKKRIFDISVTSLTRDRLGSFFALSDCVALSEWWTNQMELFIVNNLHSASL